MTTHPEKNKVALDQYVQLQQIIDRDTSRLRQELGRFPCAATCYDCCRNTATLLMSKIEVVGIQHGLAKLSGEVRNHIRAKARRTVRRLEALGHHRGDNSQLSSEMIQEIRGAKDAECPMLVAGVCSIYEHRPVICRVWGYPITNNGGISCCRKTFIRTRDLVKPVDYDSHWQVTRDLSASLGETDKTPNCYMVLDILDNLDQEGTSSVSPPRWGL